MRQRGFKEYQFLEKQFIATDGKLRQLQISCIAIPVIFLDLINQAALGYRLSG